MTADIFLSRRAALLAAACLTPTCAVAQTTLTLDVERYLVEEDVVANLGHMGAVLAPGTYLVEVTTDVPVHRMRLSTFGEDCLMAPGEVTADGQPFTSAVFPVSGVRGTCQLLATASGPGGARLGSKETALTFDDAARPYDHDRLDLVVREPATGRIIDRLDADAALYLPADAPVEIVVDLREAWRSKRPVSAIARARPARALPR